MDCDKSSQTAQSQTGLGSSDALGAAGTSPALRVEVVDPMFAIRIRAALLALWLCAPSLSFAATLQGNLASPASASALLAVDCANAGAGDPASLTVQVANLGPLSGAFVSAQIRKGTSATNTTDPIDADGGASPAVFVNGGAGRYDVFVDKSGAGAESFEVTAQCWTGAAGTGSPTGTALFSTAGGDVPTGSAGALFGLVAGLLGCASASLRAPLRGPSRAPQTKTPS